MVRLVPWTPTACCSSKKQRYWTGGGGVVWGIPVVHKERRSLLEKGTQIHPLAPLINMHITRNNLIKSVNLPSVQVHFSLINKAVFYLQASRDTLAHTFYDGAHIPAAQTFPAQKGQQQCRYNCSDCIFVKNTIQY